MKNINHLAAIFAALALTAISQANVTINFAGGEFLDSGGNPMTDGGLIILLATGVDGSFAPPTATAFVDPSDISLGSFAINHLDLAAGLIANPTPPLSNGLATGQQIMVRWFPTLTTAATTPGAGTSYGQYTYTIANTDSTAADWMIPGDGVTVDPTFLTTSLGGSLPNNAGLATLQIPGGVSAIPEPSTYALLGGLATLGLVAFRRRFQARA